MEQSQSRRAWFALAVLFAINTMNFFDRQIVASLTEPIRKEFGLSDSQMGMLGTAFTLIYAAVGVPLGRLSDQRSRTKILSAGIAVWSLLTAATGAAWNYASMFALRLGVGVGEASCAPAANSLVGDLFPAKSRATALSIMMLGLPVGIFLSSVLSGEIEARLGWRAAFYVACIPGLILAVLMLFIAEPRRGGSERNAGSAAHRPGSPYLLVLGTPTMLWIIITGAVHNFNMYAAMSFLPAYIVRYHGLSQKDGGRVASIVIGAVGVVGLLIGGRLCDWFQRSRQNGRLLVAGATMLVAAPCVYFGLEQARGDVKPFMLLMGGGVMLMYVYYAGVYAAIQDVIEPGLRATAMALYFCAMYVFGGSFGSLVTGALSDHYARSAMLAAGKSLVNGQVPDEFRALGLHDAMYMIPGLCVVLSAVLFLAAATVGRDMRKLQAWYNSENNS